MILNSFLRHSNKIAFAAGGASILAFLQAKEKIKLENSLYSENKNAKEIEWVELKTGRKIKPYELNKIMHQVEDLQFNDKNLFKELLKKGHDKKYKLDDNTESELIYLGLLNSNGKIGIHLQNVLSSIHVAPNETYAQRYSPTKNGDLVDYDVELHNGTKVRRSVVAKTMDVLSFSDSDCEIPFETAEMIRLQLMLKCKTYGYYPLFGISRSVAHDIKLSNKDGSINPVVYDVLKESDFGRHNPTKRGNGCIYL